MKCYLDTCLISNISKQDIDLTEIPALESIAYREDIELVTSPKALEEILRTSDRKVRIFLKLIYKILTKVPLRTPVFQIVSTLGGAYFGAAPLGGGITVEDELFTNLQKIFDKADAEHIFQAIQSDCDYFLTTDEETILKRAKNNENELKGLKITIKFVKPSTLVSSLEET